MTAGIEVAKLLPEIWAVSVADISQDLSTPDPVLSCSVEWVELEHSLGWETNCGMLLQLRPGMH